MSWTYGLIFPPLVAPRLVAAWAYLRYFLADHAVVRLGFENAHWVDDRLLRTNQPCPWRLARWKAEGIRTVINLRGTRGTFFALERSACTRLGLRLETFRLTAHALPRAEEIVALKAMFEAIEYPAALHCKAGADRTGLVATIYAHLVLGQPMSEARKQLGTKYLHFRSGSTGVLDHLFDTYQREAEPQGISFLDWVTGPGYCPRRIERDYRPTHFAAALTRRLRRD